MKRILVALALLAAALPARASGIGLRWGSCEGSSNRNFACDSNTGAEVLVGSFSPPAGVFGLSGVEVYGRIASAEGTVPAWWQLVNRGACRYSSMSASFSMGDLPDCEDPWGGQAMGGIAIFKTDATGAYFALAVAVPENMAQPVSAGRTYGAFKLFINHQRTTGTSGCAGCSTPMCITIERLVLGQPNPERDGNQHNEIELTQGMAGLGGAGNVVTWQGGTPRCGAGGAKPSSWGELKKRYK